MIIEKHILLGKTMGLYNNLSQYISSFDDSVQGQYDSKKWLCDELKKN